MLCALFAFSFTKHFERVPTDGGAHELFAYNEPHRDNGGGAVRPCQNCHQPHLDLFCSHVFYYGPAHHFLVPGKPTEHAATLHHQHYTTRPIIQWRQAVLQCDAQVSQSGHW